MMQFQNLDAIDLPNAERGSSAMEFTYGRYTVTYNQDFGYQPDYINLYLNADIAAAAL